MLTPNVGILLKLHPHPTLRLGRATPQLVQHVQELRTITNLVHLDLDLRQHEFLLLLMR